MALALLCRNPYLLGNVLRRPEFSLEPLTPPNNLTKAPLLNVESYNLRYPTQSA